MGISERSKRIKNKMDNRIKIFFEDSDDDIEKTFEKHSQEMRARMDSAFGAARSDSLFDRAQTGSSSNSLFQRSDPFKEADDFFSNSRSLFNSNDRGSPPSISTMMPLGASSRIGFPMDSIGSAPANDIKWTDETHWEKEIPLNSQHSYSNIGVKCKENFLEVGALPMESIGNPILLDAPNGI